MSIIIHSLSLSLTHLRTTCIFISHRRFNNYSTSTKIQRLTQHLSLSLSLHRHMHRHYHQRTPTHSQILRKKDSENTDTQQDIIHTLHTHSQSSERDHLRLHSNTMLTTAPSPSITIRVLRSTNRLVQPIHNVQRSQLIIATITGHQLLFRFSSCHHTIIGIAQSGRCGMTTHRCSTQQHLDHRTTIRRCLRLHGGRRRRGETLLLLFVWKILDDQMSKHSPPPATHTK